jgi:hypothetical protein
MLNVLDLLQGRVDTKVSAAPNTMAQADRDVSGSLLNVVTSLVFIVYFTGAILSRVSLHMPRSPGRRASRRRQQQAHYFWSVAKLCSFAETVPVQRVAWCTGATRCYELASFQGG